MATEQLSLRFDANLKRSLEQEAKREDRSVSYPTLKAIKEMLRARAEKPAAIQSVIVETDIGAFISRDAMNAWISSWDTASELAPPKPDIRPIRK